MIDEKGYVPLGIMQRLSYPKCMVFIRAVFSYYLINNNRINGNKTKEFHKFLKTFIFCQNK